MGGLARVKPQAQCHGVVDHHSARVGKGLGADVQLRSVAGPGQAQRVFTAEGVDDVAAAQRHVGPIGTDAAGFLPRGIGNLELVAALQLDVEVVGVAAVLEGKVVQRSPVVGRATQEERGGTQRRRSVGRAGFKIQLRLGVGHGDGDALGAGKTALDVGPTRQQAAAVGRAEVGVGAPAFVAHLEAVFALDAGDQFPAVAGPGEALGVGRAPAVETAAQIDRAAGQWVRLANRLLRPGTWRKAKQCQDCCGPSAHQGTRL